MDDDVVEGELLRGGCLGEEEGRDGAEGAELNDEDDEIAERGDGGGKERALPAAEDRTREDGEEEEEGEDRLDASRHEDERGGEEGVSENLDGDEEVELGGAPQPEGEPDGAEIGDNDDGCDGDVGRVGEASRVVKVGDDGGAQQE